MTRMTRMTWMTRTSMAVGAFALVWLGPLLTALASPPHEEAAGGAHGGGGGHEGAAEGIKWLGDGTLGGPGEDGKTGFLIILINFAVLMLVLNKILFKNLRRSNAEKSDVIRLELERATKARTEAEALVKEYETKLAALETEVEDILAEAKRSAAAEHDRILADARAQAEAIQTSARRAAEREAARMRTELENEIVDQAIARAEAAIRSTFGGQDQRRLVDAWVDEVSSSSIGDAN